MEIAKNIENITKLLPEHVRLVAVSKTMPNEFILEAYEAGQRVFGENKVQELAKKHDELPKDIEWHFIGHLQSNKVKYLASFVNLIHGIDSFKLLKTVNTEAKKTERVINCLLQFHIAEEETKFGFSYDEAIEILNSEEYKSLTNVCICGVMGMATYTDNENQVRAEFRNLKKYFDDLKTNFFTNDSNFTEISMGMSGDFLIAVDEGSTMVRIGSNIFGLRNYK